MKFLIISERGTFNGAALRLFKEGNEVRIFHRDPRARKTMVGLLEHVESVQAGIVWGPEVVVFDGAGQGMLATRLRVDGWKVVGGGRIQDDLELDHAFANRTMETFGIRTPNTFAFPNVSDAAKFVMAYPGRLTFEASEPPRRSFLPSSNDSLVGYLANLKKYGNYSGPCVLREWIDGVPITTEAFYSNGVPLGKPLGSIVLRELMAGGLGEQAESVACLSFAYATRQPRAVQSSLKKVGILLEQKKYTGPLSISGIVRKEKFYGTGFCSSFGADRLYALCGLLQEDLGAMLARLADPSQPTRDFLSGFSCAVGVSTFPFPHDPECSSHTREICDATRGFHVGGIEKDAWGSAVYPIDVSATESTIVTAGFNGRIAEAVGTGDSVFEAASSAEQWAESIELPCKQFRSRDVGPVAERALSGLGFANYDVPPPFPILAPEVTIQPKETKNEKVPVPAHMATTTVSMPTKHS